jgi:hypothetical protein
MPSPGGQALVFLNAPFTLVNMTYFLGALGIVIQGIYEVTYDLRGITGATGDMSVIIRNNGVDIANSRITQAVTAGGQTVFSGDIIVTLSPGDALDMQVSSSVPNNIALGPNVSASLIAKKLDSLP